MTSILCIGNFGTGRKEQVDVAKLLCELCQNSECKLILGLGNNIYPDGVRSVNDNQFLEKFEIPYQQLPENIKFYSKLCIVIFAWNFKDEIIKSLKRSKIKAKLIVPFPKKITVYEI